MPRPKSSNVYNFFKLNVITGKYICQVDSCSTEIYPHAKNCERHIQSVHFKFYNEHFDKKKPQKRSIQLNCLDNIVDIPTKTAKQSHLQQNTLSMILTTKNTINIKMTPEKLMEACTDLIILDGRPFDIIDDIGFRKIINPILTGMGNQITINKRDVKIEVKQRALQIVNEIKNLAKDRLVCLKIDYIFGKDKSIFSINIQVSSINSTAVELKTLAIIELTEQHAAVDLQQMVYTVLFNFEIEKKQIYTITIDNTRNFVQLANLSKDDHNIDEDIYVEESSFENDLKNVVSELGSLEKHLLNGINENHEQDEDVQLKPVTTVLWCAADSLRQCVNDAMSTNAIVFIVSKAREVVKKLRMLTLANQIESPHPNSLKVTLDVPTRWESTYDMLMSLHKLQDVCDGLSETYIELHMDKSEWDMIENMIKSLNPAKIAALKVQKENLTIGDFHGVWLKCYGDTMAIGSIISKSLCYKMDQREKSLFNNSVYSAGLFLDPRYQCLLNDELKCQAKTHLIDVWNAMNSITNSHKEICSSRDKDVGPKTDVQNVNDSLEAYIRTKTNVTLHNTLEVEKINSSMPVPIPLLIESFDGIPRLHNSLDIRTYWENEKFSRPELYRLAQILLCVPVTQISMERAFASLKSNMSDTCLSHSPQLKETISIIRNNYNYSKKSNS